MIQVKNNKIIMRQ